MRDRMRGEGGRKGYTYRHDVTIAWLNDACDDVILYQRCMPGCIRVTSFAHYDVTADKNKSVWV